jgi:hypothetical protein
MPQGAIASVASPAFASVVNIVGATAGQLVKTGRGMLRGITVNTAGSSSTLVVYDGTSTSGTKLGTFSSTLQSNLDSLNWQFSTGLFIVTTGTLSDVTIAYN